MEGFGSSQHFDQNGDLAYDYIPPCESGNHKECSIGNLPPRNFELPDPEGGNGYNQEGFKGNGAYEAQSGYEDPADVLIKLLEMAGEEVGYDLDSLRYAKGIDEIGNIKLKKGDKIILDEGAPSEFELTVGTSVYAINTAQNTITKIN